MRLSLPPRDPPQRLDVAIVAALAQHGQDITRSQLQRAFAAGGVTIEGKPARGSRLVDRPLSVEIALPPVQPLSAEPEALPLSVLYEDGDLLVVDKPAPMVVHASAGHRTGTLVGAVLHHLGVTADALPVLPGNDATRPGIVHRLDRDTSGVLVIAKHARAQARLAAQFRRHAIERRYWALVVGQPAWDERHVDTGHARDPADRRRFAPWQGAARRAITDLRVLQRLSAAAVIEATLSTGRTHQIRMHARALGHPVLGDALYGGIPRGEPLHGIASALPRHALHACVLGFRHPADDRPMRFSSPVPDALAQARDRLC